MTDLALRPAAAGSPAAGNGVTGPATSTRRRRVAERPRTNPPGRTEPGAAEPGAVEAAPTTAVSGIVDVRDKNFFVRVDGYLPDPGDPHLPPGLVQRLGLRRGDVVTGAAAHPTGNRRTGGGDRADARRAQRPTVTAVDTVNGAPADHLGERPDFYALTPIYPRERMRLETMPDVLTTRVIDLLTPIGKGQRALVVSPPKAGKTMVLQAIAHALAVNHPDTHVMAILIDERPEEVTDMRRTVRGEVVSSTFDRPPVDHIAVAELAIERAKRLVEQGRDVVVLLDSITRLGRAYNLAAPSNGRVMSGGIEAGALHAPKRFLGAARTIEGGGSLTIIATALVETGSLGDTVIFEEFKSTGNAELRLLRGLADRRVFPAVDVDSSSTRREELLVGAQELELVRRLRRALHTMDTQQTGEQLVDRLRKTSSNAEFLMQIARGTG
ncbi:transcription termination factor Rho [Catellatospora vulcania]|uniref:transcription termination factor Rho n=1 Tax=Catellatospora vulcania TaxID=1460450 RepID=UPI0012D3BE33|nr:transcription termination factor Rho [Catellatospora vulcania]